MAAQIAPAELARLLDTGERPRVEGWSLRAALTRYAQPAPERAGALFQLYRRIEAALHPHGKRFERDGDMVWAALTGETRPAAGSDEVPEEVVGLLRALAAIDALGDELAAWAVERAVPRPDEQVDAVVADVATRLDALGIPEEERPRPTGGRRGV